ncbi:hypothetical protein Q7689_00380 [Nocardiopsis tropica]|nr:hypothetical protein [Nocardiopsis tropica]
MELLLVACALVVVAIHGIFRLALDIRWRRMVNARLAALNAESADETEQR